MMLLTDSSVTSIVACTARAHDPVPMLLCVSSSGFRVTQCTHLQRRATVWDCIQDPVCKFHPYILVCQTCSQRLCELQSLAKSLSPASALSHLGRRMCHQFPWLPDSCVALGLALHACLIARGTSPSKTKDRRLIIQVSYGNCVGGRNSCVGPPCPHLFADSCESCYS